LITILTELQTEFIVRSGGSGGGRFPSEKSQQNPQSRKNYVSFKEFPDNLELKTILLTVLK